MTARDQDLAGCLRSTDSLSEKIQRAYFRPGTSSGLRCTRVGQFALSQEAPRGLLELSVDDVRAYLKKSKDGGKTLVVSFKRFAQFLRDTGRLDIDRVEDLLDFLKHERQR